MGLDQLPGLQRHHLADDRLAEQPFWPQAVLDCVHCAFHDGLRGLRGGDDAGLADSRPRRAGGGRSALQPLSQAILMESFPPAKRGMAMAVFGMGVVVAPIIGPVLGGWITDNYSWRWIFFINVPLGVLAALMSQAFVEDPPYLRDARESRGGKVDYIGFGVLALWLGTLQIVLDRGQEDDWFNAGWVCWASLVSLLSLIFLIAWEIRVEHPLVDIRVFRNRNFAMGTLLMTVVGVVLYSTTALLPLFLQELMGYPAMISGMAMGPRGMGAVCSLLVVGALVSRIDARLLIGLGFSILAYAVFGFGKINLEMATMNVMWPNALLGTGDGLYLRSADDHQHGRLAERTNGKRHGNLQLDAQHRRQHRHRHGNDLGRPRRSNPSGFDGRPTQPLPAGISTSAGVDIPDVGAI